MTVEYVQTKPHDYHYTALSSDDSADWPTDVDVGTELRVIDSGLTYVYNGSSWFLRLVGSAEISKSDAFGRLRVANPTTLWDSQFEYNLHPLFYDQITATGGAIAHNAAHSSASLSVTTSSGSKAQMQSFEYIRYQPGKSQLVFVTFLLAAATANLDQRIGQFDDDNGFFLELTGTTLNVVRRTKVSGSVVNNKTAQASWLIDKLDGTGRSGVTLDITKSQIFVIDYQWLGEGLIRYGFNIDGVVYWAHYEKIANVLATPSTTTANLPVRAEIVTTGTTAGARTLEFVCCAVISEGGSDAQTGHEFSGGNGGTLRTGIGTTPVPIASIRPATTLNSVTNRTQVRLESIEIFCDDAMYWRLIYAPTSITGATFAVSPSAHSSIQVDVAGTAVSGGTVVKSGYISASNKGGLSGNEVRARFPIALDAAGTNQSRGYTISVQTLGGTNKSAAAVFNWREVR